MDSEEWEWQLAAFAWLEREFGGTPRILARPDGDEFPDTTVKGHALALELLDQVKAIAGMAEWATELKPLRQAPSSYSVNNVAAVNSGPGAAGTFRITRTAEGVPIAEIHYSPDDLHHPSTLVGTLAHEMAHYLLHSAADHGPGGEDCEELLTDLAAIWLGFGIFMGNHARYAGHTIDANGQWFVSGSRGYLSERARMSALAISETLAGRDPMDAGKYLKKYLVDDLRRAVRYISTRNLEADIAAIELADYGC
ncbi:MAG TPA: hypothetical protein VGD23_11065 [Sphingomicrobium sp.]